MGNEKKNLPTQIGNEEKNALTQTEQVILPSNIELNKNPIDLLDEALKRVANLQPEVRRNNQFVFEIQERGVSFDVTKGLLEIMPGFIKVTQNPFSSDT